jgi:hypothetical protein
MGRYIQKKVNLTSFFKPVNQDFPFKIELFSRTPDIKPGQNSVFDFLYKFVQSFCPKAKRPLSTKNMY